METVNKQMSSRIKVVNILTPVISVILGLLVGAIVMIVVAMIRSRLSYWMVFWRYLCDRGDHSPITPYKLAGLSVAFAFRTGLFNIGVEGQLIVGWLAAV